MTLRLPSFQCGLFAVACMSFACTDETTSETGGDGATGQDQAATTLTSTGSGASTSFGSTTSPTATTTGAHGSSSSTGSAMTTGSTGDDSGSTQTSSEDSTGDPQTGDDDEGETNTRPVARDVEFQAPTAVATPVPFAGEDADDDPLTFIIDTPPSFGELTVTDEGSWVYVSQASFVGDDVFAYQADDGRARSNVAVAVVTVIEAATHR